MSLPVSIVIPMYNAERHIVSVLDAIFGQRYAGPFEVIVVNDGSRDSSLALVEEYRKRRPVTVIDQENQGAVAATNRGFRSARSEFVCSVDSDVVLHEDWLARIMEEFADQQVGAVQGYYKTPRSVSFWARMMGYDVEKRYDDIPGKYVTQVCTGDTAYRRAALERVGLFDSVFVYGYDNDMSYRLLAAGYKLVFRRDALCDHYWKADVGSYLKQQYRSGFGRMQLLTKHPDRRRGDSVSGLRMILQVPLTLLTSGALLAGAAVGFRGPAGLALLCFGLGLLGVLLTDRFFFAWDVFRKQKDPAVVLMPFVHVLRNGAWCWALLRWEVAKRCRR